MTGKSGDYIIEYGRMNFANNQATATWKPFHREQKSNERKFNKIFIMHMRLSENWNNVYFCTFLFFGYSKFYLMARYGFIMDKIDEL